MEVRWDPAKAKANYKKHGVRFSDAELVLYDLMALSFEDNDAEGEQWFVSIGSDVIGNVLVVVYSYRDEAIRLISARRATRKEVRIYEEGI